MEENNNSDNKGPLYFLIHAGIVLFVFIVLTIWLMGNKEGGADIARIGLQGILYLFQLVIILIAHKGTVNVKYAFLGATVVFIIVFIYEATYKYV